ncbi:MAG: hypothetical protein COX77_03125 [Candidatus Komeilibacteria bacterium CG_4_10_14_0_2_um_filter_37_10]|uniref:Uncharacterized protein n=1 Tax=Candidatus Komeilibacteria bacterium CG_4_10_14_0_2_um_filter_37_10 TaxID=1974470 RepID=A0A2M7VEF9_9BACT|nr:MAG: hypothetical protein COX77_03125 [Candidatus Komeilibacteria bacterium CG_4_10_14_0_2_um_filter_37_10]PJA93557.1 MAG: hypothetical protein CO133_01180 [Candidatus Komeilibacteria bacterium CG_4_9_14_3_um_filter_37_5]
MDITKKIVFVTVYGLPLNNKRSGPEVYGPIVQSPNRDLRTAVNTIISDVLFGSRGVNQQDNLFIQMPDGLYYSHTANIDHHMVLVIVDGLRETPLVKKEFFEKLAVDIKSHLAFLTLLKDVEIAIWIRLSESHTQICV